MSARHQAVLILAVALISLIASAQEVGSYDFTNYDQRDRARPPKPAPPPVPPKAKKGEVPPGMGGGVCSGIGRVSLDVQLVSLDKAEYQPGEDVVFTAKITNMSARWDGAGHQIEIPIAAGWRSIEPSDPAQSYSYKRAGLSMGFIAGDLRPQGDGHIPLFSSPETPGSIISLKPGEWITVRGKFSLGRGLLLLGSESHWTERDYELDKRYEFTGEGGIGFGPGRFSYDASTGIETRHCTPTFGTNMHTVAQAPKLVVIRRSAESGKDAH